MCRPVAFSYIARAHHLEFVEKPVGTKKRRDILEAFDLGADGVELELLAQCAVGRLRRGGRVATCEVRRASEERQACADELVLGLDPFRGWLTERLVSTTISAAARIVCR